VDDEDLKKERGEETEVREQSDLRIAADEMVLRVKDRKNHRHGDRSAVVERMEQRCGDQDAAFVIHGDWF
jgi:thiamine monophosphate synthase